MNKKYSHPATSTIFVLALFWAVSAASASAEVLVSDQAPRQGETLQVTLKMGGSTADAPAPTVTLHGQTAKAYPLTSENAGDSLRTYQALLAVPADLDPGKYTLKCGDEEKTLSVKSGLFPLQHISLPPAKDNFNMSPGEEEAVEGAKKTLSDARLWQGNFVPPSKARVSSGFGLKRMVNGRLLKDYFHSGIDYAGSLGSPVVATSNGTVRTCWSGL